MKNNSDKKLKEIQKEAIGVIEYIMRPNRDGVSFTPEQQEMRLKHLIFTCTNQVAEEARGQEREEWESRGIITECHNCDKIVHIFPVDASRLMEAYHQVKQADQKENKEEAERQTAEDENEVNNDWF